MKIKKNLEYVVVTLLKTEDSALVKGMITSSDGNFIRKNTAWKLFTQFFLSGFNKNGLDFFYKENETIVQDDVILSASKELKEVSVSLHSLYCPETGMLVMNIENSPVRISGTAYDVVSKHPV